MSVFAGLTFWWGMMFVCEAMVGPLVELFRTLPSKPIAHIEMNVIALLVLQLEWFSLTLCVSKTAPQILSAESSWSIWKGACAPG